MKLGPWRYPVEGGACRVQDGGDIDVIEHRWAFIEKIPPPGLFDGTNL